MAITSNTADNEKLKFKESTSVSGQPGIVVVNADGSSIGGGGSGASASQVQGTAADNAAAVGNPVRTGQVYNSATQTYSSGDIADFQSDVNGNQKVREAYAPVYEDNTNGKAVIEHRYLYSRKTADGQVIATPGLIHTISVSPTGSVTAGVLTIYDSTTEAGTIIYSVSIPVTIFSPFTVLLNVQTTNGIYVGFDATLANVQVTVSYR